MFLGQMRLALYYLRMPQDTVGKVPEHKGSEVRDNGGNKTGKQHELIFHKQIYDAEAAKG